MVRLVDIMISESDNVIAEALARQVALARDQPASFDGGAAAMDAVLASWACRPTRSASPTAAGCPAATGSAPSLLTDLIWRWPRSGTTSRSWPAIFGGLPVAGWSGTLGERLPSRRRHRGRGRAWSGPRPAR